MTECVWRELGKCVSVCDVCGRVRVYEHVDGDLHTRHYQIVSRFLDTSTLRRVYSTSGCREHKFFPD